jgi:sarcosine oxidase subunit beta
MKIADAVIIGGGIAGASVAYHLAKGGLKVVALEREPLLGSGSSAASAGVIYHHLPEKVNLQLSKKSMQALLDFESEFDAKVDFRRSGCIQTAATAEDHAELERTVEELVRMGVDARLLEPIQLTDIFPGMMVNDLLGAIHTPNDGYFDPHGMLQGYAAAARDLGTKFLARTPAIGIETQHGRVTGVRTPDGVIETGVVVNAAGPRASDVARLAGMDGLPITLVKRQIFITAPTGVIPADAPFYFDRTPPFYFRPESGGLLMSIAEYVETRTFDVNLDWSSAPILAERAVRRLASLDSIQIMRGWAGLRCMTPDRTAILGPVPESVGPRGFHLAVGFSGHGVMHAPLTGRILASMIIDQLLAFYEDIDLAALKYERFV